MSAQAESEAGRRGRGRPLQLPPCRATSRARRAHGHAGRRTARRRGPRRGRRARKQRVGAQRHAEVDRTRPSGIRRRCSSGCPPGGCAGTRYLQRCGFASETTESRRPARSAQDRDESSRRRAPRRRSIESTALRRRSPCPGNTPARIHDSAAGAAPARPCPVRRRRREAPAASRRCAREVHQRGQRPRTQRRDCILTGRQTVRSERCPIVRHESDRHRAGGARVRPSVHSA
jgi:hypothetical protein